MKLLLVGGGAESILSEGMHMGLGWDVTLIGVPRFTYKDRRLMAWRCDPHWFDGWEIARDPRIKGNGYPCYGLFTRDEVIAFHKRFKLRVVGDDNVRSTPLERRIISGPDEESTVAPDIPAMPMVAELDALLAVPNFDYVVIQLWDRS